MYVELYPKSIADLLEAVIGAVLIDAGLPDALKKLAAFGIHLFQRFIEAGSESPWSSLLGFNVTTELQLQRLHIGDHDPEISQLEALIKYRFTDQTLVKQALTHGSYQESKSFGTYQRYSDVSL